MMAADKILFAVISTSDAAAISAATASLTAWPRAQG
jgi:hypothetical protein